MLFVSDVPINSERVCSLHFDVRQVTALPIDSCFIYCVCWRVRFFTLCLPCCIGEKRRIRGSLQANLGKPNFHLKQTWFVVAVVSGDKKAGNEKKVVECFCCCCYFLFTIHFFKKMFQLYNYLTVYFNKWIKTAKRLKAIIYWDWMNWMSLFLT